MIHSVWPLRKARASVYTKSSRRWAPPTITVVLNWFEELKARVPAK